MKILLTCHQFVPDYFAGTEILTFHTAKEMQRLGHDVHVFTCSPEHDPKTAEVVFDNYVYEGIEVTRYHFFNSLDNEKKMKTYYNNAFLADYFKNYCEVLKPDIVHAFHMDKLSASIVDVCDELSIPFIFTATDFWLICQLSQLRLNDGRMCTGPNLMATNCVKHIVSQISPVTYNLLEALPNWVVALAIFAITKNLFAKKVFAKYVNIIANRPVYLKKQSRKIDEILVPTQLMKNLFEKNGISPKAMRFLPYGIRIPQSYPKQLEGQKIRIGFIGTISEHKGLHVLLQAIRLLPDDNIELKIYGDTKLSEHYTNELLRIIDNDSRVKFYGTFDNSRIGEIFSGLDVLVVPSLWYENTPLVIYSAQAANCPVIASNLGGMSEVIKDRENGLLFEVGNVRELAKAISSLTANKGFLLKLAENARKPKSIEQYAQELLDIYEAVLKQRREI